MTKRLEIYKCSVCGNIVEVLHAGAGELVCCGEPMARQEERTEDALGEKHVPVITSEDDGVKVRVGSVPHPMEEKHYIEWVEVISGGGVFRAFLKPGDEPSALFGKVPPGAEAREYCNIHGLWKGKDDA